MTGISIIAIVVATICVLAFIIVTFALVQYGKDAAHKREMERLQKEKELKEDGPAY